jgi:DNA-3-methyladenine glycosylase
MGKTLQKSFFERSTLTVARGLLGKYLVRRYPSTGSGRRSRVVAAMITEVEAYDGPHDKASHASRGRTKRNAPMFGPAGYWYVYFTYGMHWMLNIVTGREGYPAAVLIRGVENVNGPARVTKFFKIGKGFNNKKARRRTGLWIENRGARISPSYIKRSSRIGVPYAGPLWAKKRWRFHIRSGTGST